jgi:hypothetical protein
MEIDVYLKLLAAGGASILVRMLYSWFKKQNSNDSIVTERDQHLQVLKGELKECKDEHHVTLKMLEELREQNTLLRVQNGMMRQMLLNKGVTIEELAAIGSVQ